MHGSGDRSNNALRAAAGVLPSRDGRGGDNYEYGLRVWATSMGYGVVVEYWLFVVGVVGGWAVVERGELGSAWGD